MLVLVRRSADPHQAPGGGAPGAGEDVHLRQPLGMYAEQVGLTGEQLGNFPQAFTHLSLISAAINLDRALG